VSHIYLEDDDCSVLRNAGIATMWLIRNAEVALRLRAFEYRVPRRKTEGWGIKSSMILNLHQL
jgi:hypothetical protein